MTTSIALLVVHGIGSQRRGESLASCTKALQCAYPAAELLDRDGARISADDIVKQELDEAVLRQPAWEVRLYETYWAHMLSGPRVESSFSKFLFEETTWFPGFNWKCGLLPAHQYPRWLIHARTAQMWLLELAAILVYEVVPKRLHSKILDQIVADVWNYTHSLGGSLPKTSPVFGAGAAIVDCFRRTALRARTDGCQELQIIAHSLGTVIAYNALTRYESPSPAEAPMRLTRLYTIGSPLEKFQFIWTALLRPCLPGPEIQVDGTAIVTGREVQWNNFYSPLDLVSGKIKRFPEWGNVRNERLWGLGGLARAHVRYFLHPTLISRLAAGLGGGAQAVKIPWIKRAVWVLAGVLEDLMLPLAVVILLAEGGALFLVFGAMLGALLATIAYPLLVWPVNTVLGTDIGFLSAVKWTAIVYAALMLPCVTFWGTKDGYLRARKAHQAFWQGRRPRDKGPPAGARGSARQRGLPC